MSYVTKRLQQGATLIIAMIFMVVISIIALAGMEVTGLEERMAGNMRERNIAFQAAEATLLEGEDYLATTFSLPAFDGSNGLYAERTDGAHNWDEVPWGTSSAVSTYTGNIDGLAATPAYIIEHLETAGRSLDPSQVVNTNQFYRVTVRAVGQTNSSVVMLQTVYKR